MGFCITVNGSETATSLESRRFQQRLIVETNVAREEKFFLRSADHDSRRAERMAGVIKFK